MLMMFVSSKGPIWYPSSLCIESKQCEQYTRAQTYTQCENSKLVRIERMCERGKGAGQVSNK